MKEITYCIQNDMESDQKRIEITDQIDLSGGFPKAIISNPRIIVSFSNVNFESKILPENQLTERINNLLSNCFKKNQMITCEGIFLYRKRLFISKTQVYKKGELVLNKEKEHYMNQIHDIFINLHYFGLLTQIKAVIPKLLTWNWSEIVCQAETIKLGLLLL